MWFLGKQQTTEYRYKKGSTLGHTRGKRAEDELVVNISKFSQAIHCSEGD